MCRMAYDTVWNLTLTLKRKNPGADIKLGEKAAQLVCDYSK
jgi:hypothetical protein